MAQPSGPTAPGSQIIAGLVEFSVANVLQGSIPAAFLAIIADKLLENVEDVFQLQAMEGPRPDGFASCETPKVDCAA